MVSMNEMLNMPLLLVFLGLLASGVPAHGRGSIEFGAALPTENKDISLSATSSATRFLMRATILALLVVDSFAMYEKEVNVIVWLKKKLV